MTGPLHVNLQIFLEDSPESPQPGSPSPLLPSQPIPLGTLSPVWVQPDDETIFMNFFTRADVLDLKQRLGTTGKMR